MLCRLLLCIPRSFLSALLLPIFSDEPLPCRLPCRCVLPFPRASLYDLYALAYSEVVPVLPQLPSQRFYRYDQFRFHLTSFFMRHSMPAFTLGCLLFGAISPNFVFSSISLASYAGYILFITSNDIRHFVLSFSFALRSHVERPRTVCAPFLNDDAKVRQTFHLLQIFSQLFSKKMQKNFRPHIFINS